MDACELDESEEIFDVKFPSSDEPSKAVHPGEESFDLPALLVAAELPPVLGFATIASIRSHHLDAVFLLMPQIEPVRVVRLVTDHSGWEFVEKASGKNFFNQLALGRRSALDRDGERKTVASGESDDLRALAPARGTDSKAPFLALAKVASTNASSKVELALRIEQSRQQTQRFFERAAANPLLKPAMTGLERRLLLRQFAPLRPCAKHPENPVQDRTGLVPRATAIILATSRTKYGLTKTHCSSVNSQHPAIAVRGDHQSISRMQQITCLGYL